MLLLRGWKAHDISSAAILSSITLIHFPAAMSQTLAVASNETDKMTSLDNEKTKSVEKKQNQYDIFGRFWNTEYEDRTPKFYDCKAWFYFILKI
jgi:hypothetical protein